jgi:hypothetical protein
MARVNGQGLSSEHRRSSMARRKCHKKKIKLNKKKKKNATTI